MAIPVVSVECTLSSGADVCTLRVYYGQVRAIETFLILHMDHEQNASTSTVRIAGTVMYRCV